MKPRKPGTAFYGWLRIVDSGNIFCGSFKFLNVKDAKKLVKWLNRYIAWKESK